MKASSSLVAVEVFVDAAPPFCRVFVFFCAVVSVFWNNSMQQQEVYLFCQQQSYRDCLLDDAASTSSWNRQDAVAWLSN